MTGEFFEEDIKNMTGDFGVFLNGIVTIIDEFWFNDRHEAGILAIAGIFGENTTVFSDGVVGGGEDVALVI